MGHRPMIIDKCVTSWMQIFPICESDKEDPLPGHPGHPIWHLWIFLGICEERCLPRRQTYNFGGTEGPHHKFSSLWDFTNATEHLAGGWILFRCVQSHPGCTHLVALTILRNSVSFISCYVKVYINNTLLTLEIITYFSMVECWILRQGRKSGNT